MYIYVCFTVSYLTKYSLFIIFRYKDNNFHDGLVLPWDIAS